jgi:hypothetical protein
VDEEGPVTEAATLEAGGEEEEVASVLPAPPRSELPQRRPQVLRERRGAEVKEGATEEEEVVATGGGGGPGEGGAPCLGPCRLLVHGPRRAGLICVVLGWHCGLILQPSTSPTPCSCQAKISCFGPTHWPHAKWPSIVKLGHLFFSPLFCCKMEFNGCGTTVS